MMTTKFFAAVQRLVKREQNPFRVSSPGLTPPPPVTPVKMEVPLGTSSDGIRVEPGPEPNTWTVSWDAIPTVGGYEYQTNQDTRRSELWSSRVRTDAPRATFALSGGTDQCWLRVRAITLEGPGPWSEPVLIGRDDSTLRKAA